MGVTPPGIWRRARSATRAACSRAGSAVPLRRSEEVSRRPHRGGTAGVVGAGGDVAGAGGVDVAGAGSGESPGAGGAGSPGAGGAGSPGAGAAAAAAVVLDTVTVLLGATTTGAGAGVGVGIVTICLAGCAGCAGVASAVRVGLALASCKPDRCADVSVTLGAGGGCSVGSAGPGAVDWPSSGPRRVGSAGCRAHAPALLATTAAASAARRAVSVMRCDIASRVPAPCAVARYDEGLGTVPMHRWLRPSRFGRVAIRLEPRATVSAASRGASRGDRPRSIRRATATRSRAGCAT